MAGGDYIVQNNEYNSTATECLALSGGTAFTVSVSEISLAGTGAPGGYPSIYQGCHWGQCSQGPLTRSPPRAGDLTPGTLTSSWRTSQPASGVYDASYDIWFAARPRLAGQPDCDELMVWLNHRGPVQPFGALARSSVTVGGQLYDLWAGRRPHGYTVTYSRVTGATAVTGLDLGVLAADAIRRGYLSRSCYLQDVEAGFEIWRGGAGLATQAFSVAVSG